MKPNMMQWILTTIYPVLQNSMSVRNRTIYNFTNNKLHLDDHQYTATTHTSLLLQPLKETVCFIRSHVWHPSILWLIRAVRPSPRLQERHRGFGEEPRLNLSANVPSTVSCPDFCASTNSSSVSWDLLYARNVHWSLAGCHCTLQAGPWTLEWAMVPVSSATTWNVGLTWPRTFYMFSQIHVNSGCIV